MSRSIAAFAWFVCGMGCASSTAPTSATDGSHPAEITIPSSSAALAPEPVASERPPRPPTCATLAPDADRLIDGAIAGRGTWMAKSPPITAETRCCAALEIARSPSVRSAWSALDAKEFAKRGSPGDALKAMEEEGAACSLAILVWQTDIDVDIQAAAVVGRVREAIGPAALGSLLRSAEALAVFVDGSEEATLHGMLQERIALSLNQITGANVVIHGQDPAGLKAGIAVWTSAAQKLPEDAITDMRGARRVTREDQICTRDDECDALRADCSNLRCVGVRVDKRDAYGGDLECTGYGGAVGNYDCQPRFHHESPRCEAGRCTSHRVPK